MNLQLIRNIEENDKFLINGVEHVCTMSSGYANSENKNLRFTNMNLPKEIRGTVYNELYYPCLVLLKDIKSKTISIISISEAFKENVQLSLF